MRDSRRGLIVGLCAGVFFELLVLSVLSGTSASPNLWIGSNQLQCEIVDDFSICRSRLVFPDEESIL